MTDSNPALQPVEPIYSTLGADPDLAELVALFVDEMPERIGALLEQLHRGKWQQLERTAHQLKGAAGSYGFPAVTPYAARLERAVRHSEGEDQIRARLDELIHLCSRLRSGAHP
jgi:HPt (histidine-containing phosphotransfer) domain-containing protein